jgi:lipoprotein signal peptidase
VTTPPPTSQNPFFQTLVVVLIVTVIDQLSKYEAAKYGLISINPGISFGLLGGSAELVSTTILIAFAVLGVLAAKQYIVLHPRVIGLFLGGAVSNIIDRVFFAGVRDWMTLPVLMVKNNMADWAIFLAVVWLLWAEFSKSDREKRHH